MAVVIWLIILVALVIIEMATVGLVSIWFCFGALGGMLLAACNVSVWIQIVGFLVVSLILLFFTRPAAARALAAKQEKTNFDRIIGAAAVVKQAIDNDAAQGLITVFGQDWTARSEDGAVIPAGEKVTVVRVDGVKAIVNR